MAMSKVQFHDYSQDIQAAIEELAIAVLEEVAGELESAVKRNTAVDTGQTKNSWTHSVTSKGEEHTAVVGSPYMNAVWEEFGTGEYALNGNGRKGGWFYEDAEGNGHFTHGKKPRRPFFKAYTENKDKLIKHMQNKFKGALK